MFNTFAPTCEVFWLLKLSTFNFNFYVTSKEQKRKERNRRKRRKRKKKNEKKKRKERKEWKKEKKRKERKEASRQTLNLVVHFPSWLNWAPRRGLKQLLWKVEWKVEMKSGNEK